MVPTTDEPTTDNIIVGEDTMSPTKVNEDENSVGDGDN